MNFSGFEGHDCILTAGTSYIDRFGCLDTDSDGATHGERMDQSLSSWSQWVRAVEEAWRGASRILFKNRDPSE